MALRDDNPDSLWLLLDTICNAFGGMLLVAILFLLFSGRVRATAEASRVAALNSELLEHRLTIAHRDLGLAEQAAERLKVQSGGADLAERAELAHKRNRLQSEAQALVETKDKLNKDVTNLRTATQQLPDERLQSLRAEFEAAKRQKIDLENNLRATKQNVERLVTRLTDLKNQIKSERNAHIISLRLPKENVQSKISFPVIIRYGKIYFVHDPNHEFRRNSDALKFERQWNGDEKVQPIREQGIDLRRSADLLRSVSRQDFYIVCWIYGDSFGIFNQFKEFVTHSGYEYGWSPMRPENSLVLTEQNVTSPPPL